MAKQVYYTFEPDQNIANNIKVKVTKLDDDLEPQSSYTVDRMANVKCTCPANFRKTHRNRCKHLKMVELWISECGADTGKMFDGVTNEFVDRYQI